MLKKTLISLFFTWSLALPCLAIDENHYEAQYQEKITPLIKKMGEGFFTGENEVQIHYRTYLQAGAKNCLVILPGRTEPIEKYAEVVYDLTHSAAGKNSNFYLMDHRGQGSSGRLKTPRDMGYVDRFENYVKDLEIFVGTQNLESKCEKRFLLAHSMGAGIAAAFIIEHPDYFHKVALTSPMLKIMTKGLPYAAARTIVESLTFAGFGATFAPGETGFKGDTKFEKNTFTTSPVRFKMAMSIFNTRPKTKLGGVANRWLVEVMRGTSDIRSRYHEISVPLRVFHGGLEVYSEPGEMVKFCDEAIHCKRVLLPTSKHEVLMDRDENRSVVLQSLAVFFN